MEEETLPMLLICSAAVIFFSLFFVFLWKRHGINLAWFIFHIVFSTIFLLLFVKFLRQNYGLDIASSINNSVTVGFIGISWALSIFCMIVGLWFICLNKEK